MRSLLPPCNPPSLNRFLSRNAKPRVLLIQLAPDSFELSPAGSPSPLPGYAAGFSAWYVLKDLKFHVPHHRAAEDTILVRNGFPTPLSPARTSCSAPAPLLSPDNGQQSRFFPDLGRTSELNFVAENNPPIDGRLSPSHTMAALRRVHLHHPYRQTCANP